MQNCIASLISEVLSNKAYFYHWNGDEPSTVMLEHIAGAGWRAARALGFNNQPLSSPTKKIILGTVIEGLSNTQALQISVPASDQ